MAHPSRGRRIVALSAILMLLCFTSGGCSDDVETTTPSGQGASSEAAGPSGHAQRNATLKIVDYHFGGGGDTTPAVFARAMTFVADDYRVVIRLQGFDERGEVMHLGHCLGVQGREGKDLWSAELAVPLSRVPEGPVTAIFDFEDVSGERSTRIERELQLPE